MPRKPNSLLDRLLQKRAHIRWTRAARLAKDLDLHDLRGLRSEARHLRRALDRVLHIADARLAMPLMGADAIARPLGTDWAWRPDLWCGPVVPAGIASAENRAMLGDQVTIFHDCKVPELTLRQTRNTGEADIAPFGLRLDVFRFDGSFLSVVIDLPQGAAEGLRLNHLIRMDCVIEAEKPLAVFARLNVKHGPNTEQVVRALPPVQGGAPVEFDLAYTKINEKRVEKAWVDLIFEGPQMNQIMVRDLTFSRHPRAEI
ncbi:DUF6478 family protein [Phaeovulum sp.]|uniref:DUF6478 family protein n=1 Tax=Phaeovulum sp. TaxID=2934796 RepID=UPI0039E5BAF9